MSDNEYVMNTGVLGDMSNTISGQAAEYLKVIEETSAIVDDLAAHWEGNSYQTFRDGYYAHLNDLSELNNSLRTLAGELEAKADRTRDTAQKIKSILK